jgi:uncharacterized membrane protein YcaP (DUF421 family)
MEGWNQLFGITGQVTSAQECARSVVIFAYGLLLVRIAGRRAFARWSAIDIVVAVIIGSSLSRAQTGNAPMLGTMLSSALFMLLHWLLARASAASPAVSRIVEGDPIELVTAGRLDPQRLMKHNVSRAALGEALHHGGIEDAADSRSIVLEPSGTIAVLK